jgi:hypothetical protein
VKSFFGIGEALKALKEYATDDIHVLQDKDQNGAIYLKLKRPLKGLQLYREMLNLCLFRNRGDLCQID